MRKEEVRAWMRLYAVTDRAWSDEQTDAGRKTLEEQVREAIDGGVTCVQLREKSLTEREKPDKKIIKEEKRENKNCEESGEKESCEGGTGEKRDLTEETGMEEKTVDQELLARAVRMAAVCRTGERKVPFIVNDDVQVAVQSGADGVHVGQDDMSIAEVRRIVGPDMVIGASAHTVEEAKEAEAEGADYLGVGSVFVTSTKKNVRPLSMETLREICEAVTIPVVAIGGIKAENAMQLAGSGVDGIAVVSAIFAAEDCRKAAAQLKKIADAVARKRKEVISDENSTLYCRQ